MGIGAESLPEVSSPFLSSEVSFGSFSFSSNNADKNKQGRLKKDQKITSAVSVLLLLLT